MFVKAKQWMIYASIVLIAIASLLFGGAANALDLKDEGLTVRDRNGENISGFIGKKAALRLGSQGEVGRLYLFPSSASDIFAENQASITMNADGSSMSLKGDDSFIFIDGKDRNNRSQLTLRNGTIFLQAKNGTSSIRVNDNGGICIGNC